MPKHIAESRGQSGKNWLFWCVRQSLFLALCVTLACPNAALAEGFTETYNRGVHQYNSGDLPAALESFSEARDISPKEIRTRKILITINKALHRYNDAESEYLALIALEDTIQNQLDLAELYISMGKYSNASSIYQTVLAKNDKNAQAMLGSGIVEECTGNLDSAVDLYQQVIDTYPRSTQAKNAQGRLGRLTKAQSAERSSKFFPVDLEFGEAGLGWWNLHKMPLHVYIDSGDGVKGYRSEMRDLVLKALNVWTSASNDHISFIVDGSDPVTEGAWKDLDDAKPILMRMQESNLANVPSDPVPAQIHVHWTNDLYKALGLTWTSRLRDGNPVLSKAHIWLATNKLYDGSPLPSRSDPAYEAMFDEQLRMMEEVATHEFGHALGLPHLPNPNDIMAAGIYGFNARDLQEQRQLSSREVQALAEHYNNYEGNGYQLANRTALMDEQAKSDSDTITNKEDKEESGPTTNPLGGLKGSDTPDEKDKEPAEDKKSEEKPSDEEKSKESKTDSDKESADKSDEKKGPEDKKEVDEKKESAEKEEKKSPEDKKEVDAKEAAEKEEKKESEEKKEADKAKAEEEEKAKADAEKSASGEKTDEEKSEEGTDEAAGSNHSSKSSGNQTGYHPLKEAIFYLNTKKYSEALLTLDKYLKGHHNDAQALYLRAVTHVMLRDYPHAARDYKEVIRIYPDSDLSRKATDGLKKIHF